ncbi:hypothetical protein [Xanthomonas translucens]|uniref:hypothetical protein n=1 Tax=Xanthomonas campestris pv. translucens TaxID=343 RepID=UPI0002A7A6C6|nr:hypothetical protein [Xanthomonas translucens]AKK67297.1 hypothetical protein FD63_07280 [Xanthomonas translucens pv. undulosa]AVY67287.1 hypothetical protein NZ30_13485 [Xanthomonas translucens pv. undulosa]ELQ16282.1 hypothetical protein A989_02090 [Xanthomonas translucens DAR61454]MBC3971401.1 hypothetical protein [Xanthomonas translucens pv. undulosa]MCT8269696.1 hypothetical protein [Xanthomonas translucens pv. undulosa]
MLQDLAEAIARQLFERVLQLFGYGSGCLAWPVLSLGWIRAKARRDRPPRRPGQRRHGRPLFYCTASGSLVASDDAVRVLGLACWALLALAGFLLYRLAR